MAKAEAVRPAGPREEELYELVDAKFRRNADFFKAVANLTKLSAATEKSAFYRIVRGEPGTQVRWRLRQYATVLGVPPTAFLAAWEEDEAADGESGLPLRLSPREIRDALGELIARVGRLERQVAHLEQQQRPRRRRGETGS